MNIIFYLVNVIIILYYSVIVYIDSCPSFSTTTRGNSSECDKRSDSKFTNIPIISGAYCNNDGSYLCKAFAGRFEFYFNSKTDTILGPAKKSKYVDEFGYHERVPVSYNISGNINYVDKFINWAKFFAKSKNGTKFNILSTRSFNWCILTEKDWWPYKSSFKWKQYHIYFYNRQSCIYDTVKKRRQHFNTRFLQKSNLRIDLDYNPTIFAMEDPVAVDKKIRLVKHKRQHWYEVSFDVLENPTQNISYFINMTDTEEPPVKLNGTQGLFTRDTYRNYSNICVDDYPSGRDPESPKNGVLMQHWCGYDEVEISDIPEPVLRLNPGQLPYEVDLHNLPRHPESVELFYDIHLNGKDDWIKFAKDGYTFSATTTIPIDPETVRIIMLLSNFNTNEAGKFNENYPTPILADIIGKYKDNKWQIKRNYSNRVQDLNYVDDIAYLYKCKSILVILGPLYTELSPTNFSINSAGYIGSIADLGIYEIANAFFNEPNTDILWVYHRTNYLTRVRYNCGELVTAKKDGEKYFPRHGNGRPELFTNSKPDLNYFYCEECFFKSLEVYKGSISQPEAPNPENYPLEDAPPIGPSKENDSIFMWIIVGIGIIIILIMVIVCLVTIRNRRRKVRRQRETGLSGLSGTVRSNTSEMGNLERKTNRSSLVTQGGRGIGAQTLRSGFPSGQSSGATGSTRRSSLASSSKPENSRSMKTSRSGVTGSGSRSSRRSDSTRRSGRS